MGKASRRREAKEAAALQARAAAGSAPAAPVRQQGLLELNRWEKILVMFICFMCTMKFLGQYIPGVSVLMATEWAG